MPGSRAAKGFSARRLGPMMAVYLLGIFMGAIDTGIITPARTIVQNDLGVDEATGVWMITIYTLAYGAAIPVMGKLADRFGRKPIYLISIALFGLGSLFAGLSQDVGSFEMLIIARAVQAIGGGGIVPVATAEFGTSVPEEKRGLALGLVGGVYGIANIFGSSAGSLILGIFGNQNWQFIFYVNVPISLAIIVAGLVILPNHKVEKVARIDLFGITVLVVMVLSLLYGLRSIDYFSLGTSLTSLEVYPYLLIFAALIPVLIFAERRAEDPALNLSYFTRRPIAATLALSFLSGVILMGVVFIPQFAENALHVPTGTGGYFVIVLGLFSGVGAPLSGTLTDRFGPKAVLGTGFAISGIAAAVGMWWAIPSPSWASVLTTLSLMGLGLGFVVGSPLNYMMLAHTPDDESNSALATLSLMRSIGTTIAPAFLVGFLAHAGTMVADQLTAQLPQQVSAPALPYANELQKTFDTMKADPKLRDKLKDVSFPDLASQTTINIDANRNGETLPADLVDLLKTADVTNIVERTKIVAQRQFDQQTPSVIADITDGVNSGLASLATASADLKSAETKMGSGIRGISSGIDGMTQAASGMRSGIAGMTKAINGMSSGLAGTTRAIAGIESGITTVNARISQTQKALTGATHELAALEAQLATLTPADPEYAVVQGKITATKGQIAGLEQALAGQQQARAGLRSQLARLQSSQRTLRAQQQTLIAQRATLSRQLAALESKLAAARVSRADLISARAEVVSARAELADTSRKLTVLRDAVPGAFAQAKTDYLAQIDARAPLLESTFANTLNIGFQGIYGSTLVTCVIAGALLLIYPRRKQSVTEPVSAASEAS